PAHRTLAFQKEQTKLLRVTRSTLLLAKRTRFVTSCRLAPSSKVPKEHKMLLGVTRSCSELRKEQS
ncbi:hypothetical protein U1Q18_050633, partial [Sarracenia purpurea var. burkii]